MTEKITVAGFGGQGVLSLGQIISLCGMYKDLHVTFIPSYGPEMRGGTANCSVIYSDEPVGSPILTNDISILIAMNEPALHKFENSVVSGGIIIVNSDVVTQEIERDDVKVYHIDVIQQALEVGNPRMQNMVMLGAFNKVINNFTMDQINKAFTEKFDGKKKKLIPLNIEAYQRGFDNVK